MNSNNLDHKKDPRGLVLKDLDTLERTFKRREYSPKSDMRDIMFQEGQQSVIRFIREKMVG